MFLQKMSITAIFHYYTQRAVKKKVFCLHVYNENNQRIRKFLKIPFRKEILEWPECRSLADGWKWKFLNKSVKRHIRLKYNRILWTAENASCPSNHLKSAEKLLRIQEKRIHVDGVKNIWPTLSFSKKYKCCSMPSRTKNILFHLLRCPRNRQNKKPH